MKQFIVLLLIVSVFISHLHGQKEIPVFAQYGECHLNTGKCNDVIIKDTITYFGSEAGLLILNTSDPNSPEFISCYYTEKFVTNIFITDTLAFVSSYSIGYPTVSIVDIADPFNPTLIHSFETAGYEIESIFIQDNFLFLGIGYNGLYIYDISNLTELVLVAHLPDIDASDMIVRDNFIFLIDSYYFGVIDISTISEPELLCWIGDYSTPRNAIEIQGDFAYIAGKTLDIFDISNPSNPDQICEFEMVSDWLYDVCVSENNCFTLSDDSLFVVNVEYPSNPEVIDQYNFFGSYLDFQDDLLIVSKDYNYESPIGIGFFNFNESQQIDLLSEFFTDKAKDVYIHGNYVYVANGFSGLRIIDITNSGNPIIVSDCLSGHCVVELLVENNYVYVRTIYGFIILDISIPEDPVELGGYKFSNSAGIEPAYAIGKHGNYVYLGGDWFPEIYVFDVANPNNPVNSGQFSVNDWSSDLRVFDNHLYVAGYWGGMQIFDLTNPVYPQMVGYYPLGLAFKISAGENMAFVGGTVDGNTGGAEIFDLSDLSNPIHTGTYEIGGPELQCVENYLMVVNRTYQDINSSIHIVNMEDLYNPVLEQEILNVAPNGIYCKGDKLVLAEDYKFKIFGDSLTVSINPQLSSVGELTLSCSPNPVKNNTTISFHTSQNGNILLAVYGLNGELIDVLINRKLSVGNHNFKWDLKNNIGNKITRGIYILSIQSDDSQISKKVIVQENY